MDKLVSIAMATYNGALFLEEQLNSIYNQNYKNIEVVVSDDNSTDKTQEILNTYNKKYGLTYYVNTHQLGITKNFENAIAKCTGDLIVLSDQDDVWLQNKVQELVNNIGDASLIYSDGYIIEDDVKSDTKISNLNWIRPFGIDSTNRDFIKYLLLNNFILGCSIMITKELAKQSIPFYNSDYNHDWWLAICGYEANGVKYLNVPLFTYRIHNNNNSLIDFKLSQKQSFLDKLITFNAKTNKKKRLDKNLQVHKIIENLSVSNKSPFLKDMLVYFGQRDFTFLNLKSFFIAFRYRKFLYPHVSSYKKVGKVLANLFK